MNERLTKSDWIDQGLRTLAQDGASALKVGAMATKLSVSRGSFYWHFRDIAAFRSQLLEVVQERTTNQVIREIEAGALGPDRLKYLIERAFAVKPSLDRALRAWAAEDPDVAVVVATADADKVAYIAKLLVAAGVDKQRASDRAAFLLWAYLGQAISLDPRHSSITTAAINDLSGLFES